jgi:hypothetical protein
MPPGRSKARPLIRASGKGLRITISRPGAARGSRWLRPRDLHFASADLPARERRRFRRVCKSAEVGPDNPERGRKPPPWKERPARMYGGPFR